MGRGSHTSYAYDPHGNQTAAVRTVDNTPSPPANNAALPPSRSVQYTVEQQAWRMEQGSLVSRFFYGPDGARYKRIDQGNAATKRTYYLASVEMVLTNATPSLRRCIAGVVVQDIDANGGRSTSRLLHDHLGSVSAVISDANSTCCSTRTTVPSANTAGRWVTCAAAGARPCVPTAASPATKCSMTSAWCT